MVYGRKIYIFVGRYGGIDMDNKSLKIELNNGYNLMVDINDWSSEYPKEFCIYVEKDNVITQDIAIIRENAYNSNKIQTLIYADKYDEDYTNVFDIGVLNEEEYI